MFAHKIWLVLATCGGLAACGNTAGEQVLLGGAVGAGTAAATGGDIGAGAAMGAAANVLFCQANPEKCN